MAAFPHSSPDSTTYQPCDLIYYLLSLGHGFLICKTGVSNRIPVLSELLCLWRVSCWGGLLSAGTASAHRKGTCPLLSDCTRWMSHTVPCASPAGLFSVLTCLKVEFVFPFKCGCYCSSGLCRVPGSLLPPELWKDFPLSSDMFNVTEKMFNTDRAFFLSRESFSILFWSHSIFSCFSLFLEFRQLIGICLGLCLFKVSAWHSGYFAL